MKTIRRLIYGEVLRAVAFVLLAFLSLFFFFDVVDELADVGKVSAIGMVYQLRHALLYVGLQQPNRLYELMPIAVLIGTMFVMVRLAHNSEYTILRTSGLGPWRALHTLLVLGMAFAVLTFALGDYLAPLADRNAQVLKARVQGRLSVGQTGAWLKEKRESSSYSVNVTRLSVLGELQGVRLYEFDANGRLLSTTEAASGQIGSDGTWLLRDVLRRQFNTAANETAQIQNETLPQWQWPSTITRDMVSVALLRPERMKAADLYAYIQHLADTGQDAQRYEIEFWRKVFYPLSCLVMVVLALPFAYLHFRSGGITGYVFGGVMTGISFFLLNNVFGYIGNLSNWQPWLAAAAPSMLYSLLALGAFSWMVLRR